MLIQPGSETPILLEEYQQMTDPQSILRADYEEYGDEFDNCCASCTHWVGSKMTRPASWLLVTVVKLIAKLAPGQRGQSSSCIIEVLVRMWYVIQTIILFALSVAFSIIGAFLRCLASTSRKQFVYYASNQPGAFTAIAPESEPLRITTFNTALMPNFISIFNGVRPPTKRVREIAVALRHRSDHIVCLQEVFHLHCAREILRLLKDMYPYVIYNVGFQSDGLDSGLMMLSKYPLTSPRYIVHPILDGDDKYAQKGILMATAHLGGGRRVVVLNTHLNGGGPNSEAVRRKQIYNLTKSLREYITEMNDIKQAAGEPQLQPILTAFQCGDFNIGPVTKEGLPDKEWTSHIDYFTRYNYHYISSNERPLGTTFDFSIKSVGWDMQALDSWKLTTERVDHILTHVGGALTPQETAAIAANAAGANNGPELNTVTANVGSIAGLQIPYGELMIDRMHGSSDHAAIRGTFTWGIRQPPPLQGDGQPTASVQWADPSQQVALPSVGLAANGYGAFGQFAPPTTVTIHQ